MKEKTKGEILKQKGTRMVEDGEDWNGLEMTILKSLVDFFKMHERWRAPLTWRFVCVNIGTHTSFQLLYITALNKVDLVTYLHPEK